MSDSFVNVAMFIGAAERSDPAAMYEHRKRAYAFLQRMTAEKGRVLVGEPIERPCDYGIWLQSESRPADDG